MRQAHLKKELYTLKDILADSIGIFRIKLTNTLHKYNTYRPDKSLNGLTPM